MTLGIVGRKCGMTHLFTEEGITVPVTVIEAEPNRVTQIKTRKKDGYEAIQVTSGQCRPNRINKPLSGHFAKAGVEAGRGLWEFRVDNQELDQLQVGSELKVAMFTVGQKVDVAGITRGRGFAGVIKRHHFSRQDETHGNSLSHRAAGSIGQNQSPGRVFKGKRMAGHLGNVQRTVQNLEIVRIDVERNLLLIKGAIPGAPGGGVIVSPAVKLPKNK
jgi:large subunit ribosomal protein L3